MFIPLSNKLQCLSSLLMSHPHSATHSPVENMIYMAFCRSISPQCIGQVVCGKHWSFTIKSYRSPAQNEASFTSMSMQIIWAAVRLRFCISNKLATGDTTGHGPHFEARACSTHVKSVNKHFKILKNKQKQPHVTARNKPSGFLH